MSLNAHVKPIIVHKKNGFNEWIQREKYQVILEGEVVESFDDTYCFNSKNDAQYVADKINERLWRNHKIDLQRRGLWETVELPKISQDMWT